MHSRNARTGGGRGGRMRGGGGMFRPHGRGGGGGPMGPPPAPAPPPIIEQKLATQHMEIQRLLMENQRFAATHVALRQDIAAAQVDIHQLRQLVSEAESKASILESDLEKSRSEVKTLTTHKQELLLQIQQLTQELHRNETGRPRATKASFEKTPEKEKESYLAGTYSTLENWTTHLAPNGAVFYYNTTTGVTQWEKPNAVVAPPPVLVHSLAAQSHTSTSQSHPLSAGLPVAQQYLPLPPHLYSAPGLPTAQTMPTNPLSFLPSGAS